MPELILTLQELSCERDERVLFASVNYQCPASSLLQIIGFNGSGKTTLLRTVAGLLEPTQGCVSWCGHPIQQQRLAFSQALLYLGHQVPVKGFLTARENLEWLAQFNTVRRDVSADEALAQMGLYGFEHTPCHALSAGQKRRVLLAQLYLSAAPLWILDEPFTAIDRQGVAQLEQLLEQHRARGGIALLTSHQPLALTGLTTLDLAHFQAPQEVTDEWD